MSEIPARYVTATSKGRIHVDLEDSVEQFRSAMLAEGITPPAIIVADGTLRKFSTNGKKYDKAGWYVLHTNGIPTGSFGDFRAGVHTSWRADIGRPLTSVEEAKHRSAMNAIRRVREVEETQRRAEARQQADQIWAAAKPSTKHQYLSRKGIQPHGARAYKGALLIPVMIGEDLHSLQFIYADGKKRFLTDGRIAGCYYIIEHPKGTAEVAAICVAEGFATGATIFEATNYPVAVAFNAGNLEPVAKAMRDRFPDLPVVICADDDVGTAGNPGLSKATKAALSVGGLLAIPDFKANRPAGVTDFNDMALLTDLESVRRVIMNVVTSAESEPADTKAAPMPTAISSTGSSSEHRCNLLTTSAAELKPVPQFAAELLPEPLCKWVMDIARRQSTAADYVAVTLLAALSTVIGRKARIYPKRYDDWLVVPNLWAMLIGRPSAGKTPAMREALKPLRQLATNALEQFKADTAGYKAVLKLQEMKAKAAEKNARKALDEGDDLLAMRLLTTATTSEPLPSQPRYIVNDVTVEKLGELLNQNPNGLLLERDELYGWLRTLDREDRSNDRTFFLEASSGDGAYTYDRISRGTLHIPALCLSIVGGIQPTRLAPYISQAVQGGYGDDGFMQRFQLAVYPDPPSFNWVDQPPNLEAQHAVHRTFAALAALKPRQGDHIALRFNDEAQEKFYQWFDSNEQTIRAQVLHPMMESHLIKFRSLIPSLALILELAQNPTATFVGLEAVTIACAWGKYLRSHAERIYSLGY